MATKPWFMAHGISVDYPGRSKTHLWHKAAPLRAVHSASLALDPGQTVGIIGESGSGKSTLGRALVQLVRPTQGVVQLGDTVLSDLWGPTTRHHRPSAALRAARRRLQMIFQDSWASLDPTQSIGQTIGEPLAIEGRCSPQHISARVIELLVEVGLDASLAQRLPHALSGGQRQRVNIARALCAEPNIIVADEPTSALDVSVKGHVLFLLQALVRARHLGLVFISHDLASVRFIAQKVSVMYAGRIIESGPTHSIFKAAKHPYTQALLEAAPQANPLLQRARLHRSVTASATHVPDTVGCPYQSCCPRSIALCASSLPVLTGCDSDHVVACHRAHDEP